MPPEEQQNQSTDLEQVSDGVANDAGTAAEQPAYQRVTPEEAATLPYPELKRRMKLEASLHDQGLLPDASATGTTGEDSEDVESATSAGQGQQGTQRSGGSQAGGPGQSGEADVAGLLGQAQERLKTLEAERAEERRAAAQREQERERQEMLAQHKRVEDHIATLPQQQQADARRFYANQLRESALNEYTTFLGQREAAIRQAEVAQARHTIPNLLNELAGDVASRHGVKPDLLREYISSKEFSDLLVAANTEEALTAVAANAGQWMEFLATREEGRLAAERERRRQNAVQNPRVARDTPKGGVPTAGGDMDLANRIQNMSSAEFMAWKKDQLRANAR